MPTSTVCLSRMVDLALGTPELGAVNFNVLHSLLHAVLQHLNIAEVKADLPDGEDIGERVHTLDSGIDTTSEGKQDGRRQPIDLESDSGVTGFRSASEDGIDQGSSSSDKGKSIPVTRTPYHAVEERIERLEQQLARLGSLPSTRELMEMTSGSSDPQANKVPRPVADMWQSMQLSRKVDANTQGVSKLMSLVEDLMREMQLTKEANEEMKKKLQNSTIDANKWEELVNKVNELEKLTHEFQQRLSSLPNEEFFNGFVTWAALEDALNGLKQQYDSQSQQQPTQVQQQPTQVEAPPPVIERVVVDSSNQTDAYSRPTSRHQSRASTPGPSAQLQDLLERLGRLHEQHDALEERVEQLEADMKNKASKEELDGISANINEQLRNLMAEFNLMKDGRARDQDSLSNLNNIIQRLQDEMDRLNKATQRLCDDVNSHKSEIQKLHTVAETLEDKKADKEFVYNEINAKADKEHLDAKVNRHQFDLTCNELNQMITDLINKLLGNEGEWRNAVGQLSSEIDSKMDRLEFGPFRDELERQLRALASKLSTLQTGGSRGLTDDEAAGIRKQLIQRFHCISCDKPVDMVPQKPQPSLPGQPGLPENKSMRPYLVYDLDQIRQYARSNGGNQFGTDGPVTDLYATARACGGSHTLTFPHRRITRLQHVREPSYLNKSHVAGNGAKLPNVQPPKSSKSARRQQTAGSQLPSSLPQAGNSRPSSARLTSRPISADVSASPRIGNNQRSMTAAPGSRNGIMTPLQHSGSRTPTQAFTVQLPRLSPDDKQRITTDDVTHVAGEHSADDSLTGVNEPAEDDAIAYQQHMISAEDNYDDDGNGYYDEDVAADKAVLAKGGDYEENDNGKEEEPQDANHTITDDVITE